MFLCSFILLAYRWLFNCMKVAMLFMCRMRQDILLRTIKICTRWNFFSLSTIINFFFIRAFPAHFHYLVSSLCMAYFCDVNIVYDCHEILLMMLSVILFCSTWNVASFNPTTGALVNSIGNFCSLQKQPEKGEWKN